MNESPNIRRMEPADLDFAFQLTSLEGWLSETRETFEVFLENDPDGCLVAEVDGKRVGVIVATGYGEIGFLGELIVLSEFRNRGIGLLLLKRAIAYLQGRGARSLFLDGDLPAVPLYERMGFRKVCRSLRFLGRIDGDRTRT